MNITIVGTGYVGLVTGTTLAELGNTVYCVDIDEKKVEGMKKGIVPIYEPNLEEMFLRNIQAQRLFFTTNLKEAVDQSEVVYLALPTPPGEDGSADLSYVLKVANDIGDIITEYKVIVNKSTVPVGTADQVRNAIAAKTQIPFDVVSSPEFLREGFAVEDSMNPARVVVGSSSEKAREIMAKIYQPFTNMGVPIIFMDEKSSELTKYAANSFLAVKITFMNEIANFCERVGADVDKVRLGMGSDDRIGHRFLFPGIGYGGSCFPKDVKALIKSGKEAAFNFQILEATENVNQNQKVILVSEIEKYFGGNLKGKKIALWGLAFKANTDDIREASSLDNIKILLEKGATITAYDTIAESNVKKVLGDKITYASDMYSALEGADALLIATEWSEFKNPNFDLMAEKMNGKAIFDGRNMFALEQVEGTGFYYKSIGRKTLG
ncbi:UDP-glucose dehydrogenase family protein [Riemerella anatipestifer]|uniref:UDP-glucose dehydrogenase family protein n=1 Tax=Riemerella anatipestifer TaxID=34085 RepID=UPI001BDAB4C1|nr:UDP-glucose/GDP-mannose dehydrogenase family protein [Riemerella anatipestifer]MBT0525964.1 UDP-glucose/GDP-mannose dehydrogenase family protein [Riemerella anatipestifer]MBT0527807.1 UDP-glucose/GDP-mannose dehydrogenase family protein [Riemerella anatipestifer]MBT0529847.1 UDP-glucose/GDP-mannose dehydrogenase family protein [Riemerella anatipestifer]MBT0531407.1 UDP-glucose/GDP-mannose dehydrogenase family protein [Riemerella anatipestifer]MBT0535502.1 UDP-glucose/GDP-mannose dehydrogena